MKREKKWLGLTFPFFLFFLAIQRRPSIEVFNGEKRKSRQLASIPVCECFFHSHYSPFIRSPDEFLATPDQKMVGEIKMTLDHDPDGHTLKIIIFGVKG